MQALTVSRNRFACGIPHSVGCRPTPATCLHSRPVKAGAKLVAHAKDKTTGNETLDTALDVARGFVDSAAAMVPESVPRPMAKGGVAVAGGLIVFWLLQKVVSTAITLALLGGAAYLYFRSSSSNDSSSGGGGSSGGGKGRGDSLDDPLADARRIMDKYK